MDIRRISFLLLWLTMLIAPLSAEAIESPLKVQIIKQIFGKAKKGDWVLTESKKGYCTKTTVVERKDHLLTLEIENIIKGKLESKTIQKIDLSLNKIVEATLLSGDGSVIRIAVDDLLFNKIEVTKYKKIKKEHIRVDAGEFDCDVYKAIVDDKVVLLWINDSIPVNQIVKAKIKHAIIKLIDYGSLEDVATVV